MAAEEGPDVLFCMPNRTDCPIALSDAVRRGEVGCIASRLAREGAIVARMSAVEEMAGMDVLCSDKTGTLTLNKLSVDDKSVLAMAGFSIDDVMKYAALSAQVRVRSCGLCLSGLLHR
jgi:cation transport ATPase